MMGVTHALMGGLLGASSMFFTPELFLAAVAAGFLGGLFPDLDLAWKHRESLHFPVGYTVLSSVLIGAAAATGNYYVVLASYFTASAWLHSWIDILGGGLEERPWEGTTDKGVYSHSLDKWFPPLQIIRYDGAPEDFLLTVFLGASLYPLLNGYPEAQKVVVASVIIGGFYSLVRKKLLDARDFLLKFFHSLID
ncbi:metal-dependent hydrolase [Candidatus Nanohalovita haloferacivicina]|uniref:metal-dependent hydrolase n=1 Tax=Candidatus Nanohalovita haloferacivicina TaxID=2978046 RepID=UPI00325FBD4B